MYLGSSSFTKLIIEQLIYLGSFTRLIIEQLIIEQQNVDLADRTSDEFRFICI